jgi:hypothetical protein
MMDENMFGNAMFDNTMWAGHWLWSKRIAYDT